MIIAIIILLIVIYYINKNFFECFSDNKNPSLEAVAKINDLYYMLMREKDANAREIIKSKIKEAFDDIEKRLVNNYDKYKLQNIYLIEILPLLKNEGLSSEEKFKMSMNNVIFLINYSTNSSYYDFSSNITDIRAKFRELNGFYSDVYITKIYKYETVREKIDRLKKQIYDLLLKVTTADELSSSGINLILNTTLQRSYEINDITQINGQIDTFNEKIKNINYKLNLDISKNNVVNNKTMDNIRKNKDKEVFDMIQMEINKIYNSFDVIIYIYKNNGNKSQLPGLIDIIYKSIHNIIGYNDKNAGYKVKITTVKTAIIKPILENDLMNSNKDDAEMIKIKNRFYEGIIEIKNIIIANYKSEFI
jgi:hypothetical protein